MFTSYCAQPAAADHADHGTTANTGSAPQAPDLSEGEVVRWDAATRRITLRHGELRNLDMPPMTMVFRVREAIPAAAQVPGARVRFLAERDAGGFVASRIEPAHP
ncbi:copper-binding protein [Paracidovorax oryzae]|uniref:copper-binding protein n=1 Tax=Paracidovorax oryzae TaxID=862720 RepID=UPI001ED9477D|nr:copper-binding protein [Paracidovorax oryzae]